MNITRQLFRLALLGAIDHQITHTVVVGSVFAGSYRAAGDRIIPRITGTAYVTAEATLLLDARDPFCWGIRP